LGKEVLNRVTIVQFPARFDVLIFGGIVAVALVIGIKTGT